MARVVINMAQTEHEHAYAAEPVGHPEYLMLACNHEGEGGRDCGQTHYAHEYCLSSEDVSEYHPKNWLVEYYWNRDTRDYENYDGDIVRVAIHKARQHRHAFEFAYPMVEEDLGVHIDNFPGWGFTGGCWSDFPKTVESGCFFSKGSPGTKLYLRNIEWSNPITMVVYDGTDGEEPMIGNDVQKSHFHYYEIMINDATYCATDSPVQGLTTCLKGHEKCFYSVKTVNDKYDGAILYAGIPGYYPPPSPAWTYPPPSGFEEYWTERATDLEEN